VLRALAPQDVAQLGQAHLGAVLLDQSVDPQSAAALAAAARDLQHRKLRRSDAERDHVTFHARHPESRQQIQQQRPLGCLDVGQEIVELSGHGQGRADARELLDRGPRLAFAGLEDAADHARQPLDQLGPEDLEGIQCIIVMCAAPTATRTA
jgi:hypothetical protein